MADEVGVLVKALDILECLVREDGLTAGELAKRATVSRPAAYRILNTLQRRGYVMTRAGVRRYTLGPAMYAYSGALSRSGGLPMLGRPIMSRLAEEFGETVNIGVLGDGRVLYVDMLESGQRLRTTVGVGDTDGVHSTALGKAMIALLPNAELTTLLEQLDLVANTPSTITDTGKLLADLEVVRRHGYAIDDEENVAGSRCVAAAVADAEGRPLAAISVSGPTSRMPDEALHRIGRRVRLAAAELSQGIPEQ